MSDPNINTNDLLFDRLVDGELPPDERRALLSSLDDREDGWRRCALAFLQAQAWRREFTNLIHDPQPVAKSGVAKASTSGQRSALGWLALAASVALAFTLGLIIRGSGTPIEPERVSHDVVALDTTDDEVDSLDEATHLADSDDALRMWIPSAEGRAQPLYVPLVDASALDRQLGLQFRSGISDDMRRRLEAEGYRVESRRRYAPLWTDEGRPLVVPVEDTKIVPVSRQVY